MSFVTSQAAGPSPTIKARRKSFLICTSAAWSSETVAIEYCSEDSGVATDWVPLRINGSGTPVSFSSNNGLPVASNLYYRFVKSAGVATVKMELVDDIY